MRARQGGEGLRPPSQVDFKTGRLSGSVGAMKVLTQPAARLAPECLWFAWLACVLISTAVLVGPSLSLILRQQIESEENAALDYQFFLFSKVFHVADYGLMAVLTALLPAGRRLRGLLLVFLSVHAAGTEFLQQFVETRSGTWQDVVLDHLGMGLGVALTWRWWR